MGIPGFNLWFSNKHKDAYLPLSRVRVDHLYIDMNSVLHNVMRQGGCLGIYVRTRMDLHTCILTHLAVGQYLTKTGESHTLVHLRLLLCFPHACP